MTALRLWRDCRFSAFAEASDFAKASSDGSADGSVFDWMTVERRPTVDGGRLTEDGYPHAESARALFPDCKNQRRCAWTIAIAKPERQRFRRTCVVILAKIRLIVFSKNFDRPGIAAEEPQRPPIRSEVPDWDTGIILHYGRCIVQ